MINNLISAYEISLLALLGWREARSESSEAIYQVMWTVRNRAEHPKWWGKDFASVITKKWQYSSIAAPNDKQLILYPLRDDEVFARILEMAYDIYYKDYYHGERAKFPSADSYYDSSIPPPSWATDDKKVGTIGTFTFYNIDSSTDD